MELLTWINFEQEKDSGEGIVIFGSRQAKPWEDIRRSANSPWGCPFPQEFRFCHKYKWLPDLMSQ